MISFVAFLISISFICAAAKDYKSNWSALDDGSKFMYYRGLISGISWQNAINKMQEAKEKDARHRLILYVIGNIERLDAQSVLRVISELYNDPSNAQLHPDVIFFPAAAKLLGYPEKELAEGLRILRAASP